MDHLRFEFWPSGNPHPSLKLRKEKFEMFIFMYKIPKSANMSIVFYKSIGNGAVQQMLMRRGILYKKREIGGPDLEKAPHNGNNSWKE